MRYVLRADASQSIGAGHVMRSSAIAEELIARGENVIFVGQISELLWLVDRTNRLGFSQVISEPAGFDANADTDVLILDSYTVPLDDAFIQQSKWKAVATIVDDQSPAYKCNLMIHPGLSSDWMPVTDANILAGPKYIPIRKSIQKPKMHETKKSLFEILVVGGGTDTFNFVGAICKVLRNIDTQFHATIFTNNRDIVMIDSKFTIVPIGDELDEHASRADLVFTTASTTSLEFIARETAVGIGCSVDNQEQYYQILSRLGIAIPVGRFRAGNWEINKEKIVELVVSANLRESLKSKCVGLIDLDGANRITDEIQAL